MSRRAIVEELSDSDSDPDIQDISTVAHINRDSGSSLIEDPAQSIPSTYQARTSQSQPSQPSAPQKPAIDPATVKEWHCLYPIYFDASRSRQEGRRVKKENAVANPLARSLAECVAQMGLKHVFEPGKMHPKDWGNVGRVKVELNGQQLVKNKHHLYLIIADFLKNNPTTPSDPLKLPIRGLPMPKEPLPPPAVPRGWKINAILPMHSPAVTGGGVSENFLGDMMKEMGNMPGGAGALPGGAGGAGGGGMMSQMQQLAQMMGGMGGGDPAPSRAEPKIKKIRAGRR